MNLDDYSRVWAARAEETEPDLSLVQAWLSTIQTVPVESVAIRSIRSGPDLRTAHSRSTEHTRLLMESDAQLPPIIVHRSTLKLIDGAHRLRVAMARKQDVVPARYFDGSEADAFVLAVRANVAHGLPLSLNERKAAALRLILEHPCWSDRMIASATGVSHTTVSTERQRATGRAGRLHSRVGKDGKVRPMATDKGRRIAAKLIRDSPTMSLREISRMAGISTGTVRDVRDRLNRGVDPVPGHADPADTPGSPKVSSATSIGADNGTSSHIQQAILRSLQRDPALRFSDRGRSVLRLVSGIVNSRAGAEQTLLDAPSHCHCHLAKLARANAQFWSNLADELEA